MIWMEKMLGDHPDIPGRLIPYPEVWTSDLTRLAGHVGPESRTGPGLAGAADRPIPGRHHRPASAGIADRPIPDRHHRLAHSRPASAASLPLS